MRLIGILHVLSNIMVAILLYTDNVVVFSKSKACLERLLNKLYKFCNSSSLDVSLCKTKKSALILTLMATLTLQVKDLELTPICKEYQLKYEATTPVDIEVIFQLCM